MHNLILTGRQWSAQAVRGDAAARRLAPISGALTNTSLIEKMGDADTRNDHLSDADIPSERVTLNCWLTFMISIV